MSLFTLHSKYDTKKKRFWEIVEAHLHVEAPDHNCNVNRENATTENMKKSANTNTEKVITSRKVRWTQIFKKGHCVQSNLLV